jgi:histidinol phosphatase-like PHP family hydrolase
MERAALDLVPRRKQRRSLDRTPLDNGTIAELLARKAEQASGHLARAFRRAARSAFVWPIEAAELLRAGRSLTELASVGPYMEKLIRKWIEAPPALAEAPAIRRHFLTLAQANGILAANPSWASRFKGDLQMHSTWSDGGDTIRAMAQAAKERGYEYIAITDHSKGLRIAGGIDESALHLQVKEIDKVNEELASAGCRVRVLTSIELNLRPDGRGDMDSRALRELDVVVGSFHSALRRNEDQTERYLAALRNPDIQILGHPRGRIYNYRPGLSADWPRVFGTAAELDKAVELDSYPDRQDVDIDLLRVAQGSGVKIAIDTDAHSASQLEFIKLGLAAALLAGISADRVVNFKRREQLLAWADNVRSGH